MGLLPLLEKEATESVMTFISGKSNSGFMNSSSDLSIDVSLEWIWVEPSCGVNCSSETLEIDCVGLG